MDVVIFGASGMVGQGILRECLLDPGVERVLAVGRAPLALRDAKLESAVVPDLRDLSSVEERLRQCDACFFPLGVSSSGLDERRFSELTYDLTLAWARTLARVSPQMAFLYVSGVGTGGKAMWARVKGRTEAALLGLFPDAYMVRLGMLRPVHGEVSRTRLARALYTVLGPLAPVVQALAPGLVIDSDALGRAMIRAARERPPTHVLEMRDLQALARPGP